MRKLSIAATFLSLLISGCGSKGDTVAKDFEIIPIDNPAATMTLDNFKDKVVVLDFWATWCSPCRQTMPIIDALHRAYGSLGVEIVALSDEERSKVLEFERSSKFGYPVYLDPLGKAAKDYGVEGLPHTVVIGADRKIYWRGHPGDKDALRRAVEDALTARDAKKA